jgi:hypothetical protein
MVLFLDATLFQLSVCPSVFTSHVSAVYPLQVTGKVEVGSRLARLPSICVLFCDQGPPVLHHLPLFLRCCICRTECELSCSSVPLRPSGSLSHSSPFLQSPTHIKSFHLGRRTRAAGAGREVRNPSSHSRTISVRQENPVALA